MPRWLLLAIVLPRLIIFALALHNPSYQVQPDSVGYIALAQNLRQHFSFSQNAETLLPETRRLPGYPLFIAPFVMLPDQGLPWIALLQTILGCLTVLIAWRWLGTFTSPRGAAIGSLILGIDLLVLLHTPIILTEPLYLFLETAAIAFSWQVINRPAPASALGAGLLWGATSLVRPVAIFMAVAGSNFLWKNRRALVAFLIGLSVLPGIWIARNVQVAGYPWISSQGGRDLMMYPATAVRAIDQNISSQEALDQLENQVTAAHPNGFAHPHEREKASGKIAVKVLTQHPFIFLRYEIDSLARMLGGTGIDLLAGLLWPDVDKGPGALRPISTGHGTLGLLHRYPILIPVQLVYWAFLLATYIFFWVGIVRLWRAGERQNALFLAGGLLGLLLLSGHMVNYRIRFPIWPFLAGGVGAAFGMRRK